MTEIRRALPFLALALALLVAGCSLLPVPGLREPSAASPAPVLGQDLASQHAAWLAQGIDSYSWQVWFGCGCGISGAWVVTVVDGAVTGVVRDQGPVDRAAVAAAPLTVDALYDEAMVAAQHGGHVTGTWGCCGVPTTLNIDRDPNAIDDELSVTVRDFAPAGP